MAIIKTEVVKSNVEKDLERILPKSEQSSRRRGVFSGQRLKLEVLGKQEGFHYAWINDDGNKITLAQQGGYEFVHADEVELGFNNVTPRNSDEGTRIKTHVGSTSNGEPMFAYLFKIKQEFFDEDKQETNAYLDKIDEQIKGGNIEGTVGNNGRYIPSQGISIKR